MVVILARANSKTYFTGNFSLAEVGKNQDSNSQPRLLLVEFEKQGMMAKVIVMFSLAIWASRVCFCSKFHGFDPTTEIALTFFPCKEQGFLFVACLSRLRMECLLLLPQIQRAFEIYLDSP